VVRSRQGKGQGGRREAWSGQGYMAARYDEAGARTGSAMSAPGPRNQCSWGGREGGKESGDEREREKLGFPGRGREGKVRKLYFPF
jgi:hypothetical protein